MAFSVCCLQLLVLCAFFQQCQGSIFHRTSCSSFLLFSQLASHWHLGLSACRLLCTPAILPFQMGRMSHALPAFGFRMSSVINACFGCVQVLRSLMQVEIICCPCLSFFHKFPDCNEEALVASLQALGSSMWSEFNVQLLGLIKLRWGLRRISMTFASQLRSSVVHACRSSTVSSMWSLITI